MDKKIVVTKWGCLLNRNNQLLNCEIGWELTEINHFHNIVGKWVPNKLKSV